jgi:hypothetical protein
VTCERSGGTAKETKQKEKESERTPRETQAGKRTFVGLPRWERERERRTHEHVASEGRREKKWFRRPFIHSSGLSSFSRSFSRARRRIVGAFSGRRLSQAGIRVKFRA